MFKKMKSHSVSISSNLSKPFDFTLESIKDTIKNGHSSLLSDNQFSGELKNYHRLKKFLGKKRNPPENLTKEEINEIKDKLEDIKIKLIKVSKDNKTFNIEIEDENEICTSIDILQSPYLIYKIYENVNRIDAELITENILFSNEMKSLTAYEFEFFYIEKDELKTINNFQGLLKIKIDDIIISPKEISKIQVNNNKIKEDVYNLQIKPFLLIMKSPLVILEDDDLIYENIYHSIDSNLKLIAPKDISKKYFYYYTVNKNLQEKYFFILTEERKKFIELLKNFLLIGCETI